jgi:hypothetical protein
MAMLRPALAALATALLLLMLTPSTTPYSPHNPGPDGLSKFAAMCTLADQADVFVLAPGAGLPQYNVSASRTPIVDPFINDGDPRAPIANARGRPAAAPNATPLTGTGTPIVYTSPGSFAGTTRGPFPLALAVKTGNKTVYIYHAALFSNRAIDKNLQLAKEVCRQPVKVVVADPDPAHLLHEHLDNARPWAAPAVLTAISLYLAVKKTAWPPRRAK